MFLLVLLLMVGLKGKFVDVFGWFVGELVWLFLLRFLLFVERDWVEVVGCFVVVELVWLFLLRFLLFGFVDLELGWIDEVVVVDWVIIFFVLEVVNDVIICVVFFVVVVVVFLVDVILFLFNLKFVFDFVEDNVFVGNFEDGDVFKLELFLFFIFLLLLGLFFFFVVSEELVDGDIEVLFLIKLGIDFGLDENKMIFIKKIVIIIIERII